MSIPFTQFCLPNAKRINVSIDRPSHIEAKASRLIVDGHYFEIEKLRNGMVNMDCQDAKGELVASALSSDGPGIPDSIDELVLAAFERTYPETK